MHLKAGQRRRPKQLRSRLMVETIIEAAGRVFAEAGYEAATTNQIAERAGISIGSLYQYFPHKDSLLLEAQKAHREDLLRVCGRSVAASRHLPLREAVKGLVRDSLDIHLKAPKLHSAFEQWLPRDSKLIDRSGFNDAMHLLVADFVRERCEEADGDRLNSAVHVILNMCRSVIHASLEEGGAEEGREDILNHLTDSILGCLAPLGVRVSGACPEAKET